MIGDTFVASWAVFLMVRYSQNVCMSAGFSTAYTEASKVRGMNPLHCKIRQNSVLKAIDLI